jgi:putative transposase
LSRYTHRVAISNTRLIAHDERGVAFQYKDYRVDGLARRKIMTLAADEFIRRFMLHILPKGFHRIRHYGLFANTSRADNIARLRELLGSAPPTEKGASPNQDEPAEMVLPPCPCCGGRMIVIEFFERGTQPRYPQPSVTIIRIDTS